MPATLPPLRYFWPSAAASFFPSFAANHSLHRPRASRQGATASLLAVIPLTILTRVFAITQKTPVTVFLLTGIFPLVPGAGIYYTAYYFIQNENALALAKGISTFKIAVALAIGISLVLCVPLPKRK